MRLHGAVRAREDTACGGACVECAGIINCDGEVFSLAISAGVNGEISGRARSDWPLCHFGAQGKKNSNTTLMNCFAVAGRERDAGVGWGGAISSTEPSSLGTAEKGRHPVSKVNTLISSV